MMLSIDDIEIKIKKYDREKNFVIANIIVLDVIEIRGFVLRFTTTKHSLNRPVWVITPPSVRGRNKTFFHIARFKDSALWQQLQKAFIEEADRYTKTV